MSVTVVETTALPEVWTAERAASNGAVFLDEQRPGWADEVDPDSLELSEACNCVLGQLYGQYWRGVESLHLGDGHPGKPRVTNLGFQAPTWGFEGLNDAWRREIAARRTP